MITMPSSVRRSPLNIVHAGLDIMQAEIDAQGAAAQVVISPETAKMVRNMFSASETAIHILNDLLHYEHIDAGDPERVFPCHGQ